MVDLLLYLGITLAGYFLGSKIRDKKERFYWTGKVQTVAIAVLVLLMGMRMGSNKEVTDNLSTIGLSAFFMTLVIMGFSIAAIIFARKLIGIDRYGQMKVKAAEEINPSEALAEEIDEIEEEEERGGLSAMTVVIVAAVLTGMAVGFFFIRNAFSGNMDFFDSLAGNGIRIGLCILLIFVGMDLGLDGTVVDNFKKVGLRILVFPVAVIIGTLTASALCTLFMPISIKEGLAIGAGFGWYTLAPGIIMENGYVTASAISFLHNVFRELFSILFIPLVAKKIGFVETTGMPGAAAMDVCLPIVEKSTRSDIAVYSFVSGVILSIAVPVMVPLIIG